MEEEIGALGDRTSHFGSEFLSRDYSEKFY